ncbi:MAG TPA: DUF6790 family protein, partial [Cytophaga sp.]|nr:DUF6790 family protein [Cytophaga sp.]
MNLPYIIVVSILTFILPLTGAWVQKKIQGISFSFDLLGKWFIFSAVGLRLFMAGCRQIFSPAFTAEEIFHIHSSEVYPIVRELGFANLCFGLIGIFSLTKSHWRIVSAFGSGLYYGLAAILHVTKDASGVNELFALITDTLIFSFLLIYF